MGGMIPLALGQMTSLAYLNCTCGFNVKLGLLAGMVNPYSCSIGTAKNSLSTKGN